MGVLWRHGRETRMRNGDVLDPLWILHTVPAIRNYLLSRGIDPFTKPPARPRKGCSTFPLYDFIRTTVLLTQRAISQIITVHPDYRRGGFRWPGIIDGAGSSVNHRVIKTPTVRPSCYSERRKVK